MNILHIDSSILGAASASRVLSQEAVADLRKMNAGASVTYRDLAADPLAHLSGAYFGAMAGGAPSTGLESELETGVAVLEEFLAADVVVIGVALYNFSVPSQLKAWVDRLFVPGKTFRYTEKGSEGLAGGKRVVLAVARGGFYGPGSPTQSFEHAETYLRAVFTALGVTDIDGVVAEGLKVGPEQREAAMAKARLRILELA